MNLSYSNLWKKVVFLLCLSCVAFLPLAQAAEPAAQGTDEVWSILSKAVGLTEKNPKSGTKCEIHSLIKGPMGITLSAESDVVAQSIASSVSHTEGAVNMSLQFMGLNKEFSLPVNTYTQIKGNKLTVYTLQGDGSWKVEKLQNAVDLSERIKKVMEKAPTVLAKYADAAITGERDGLVDIRLTLRKDVAMPALSALLEDKELVELYQKGQQYVAPVTADNVETHLVVSRETGAITSLQMDLSNWLKEELLLLNSMPEITNSLGLPQIDFSEAECTLTMNCSVESLPQDYQLTIPKEVKKKAKSANKK